MQEIIVSKEVEAVEVDYKLPKLTGTERQVSWARTIRGQFLSQAFKGFDPSLAKELDLARNERVSKTWIEAYRPFLGDANEGLRQKAVIDERNHMEAKMVELDRVKEKAKFSKILSDMHAARKWEKYIGVLPEIDGMSQSQVNYARRCRYLLLKDLPTTEIPCNAKSTDASEWISNWLKFESRIKTAEPSKDDLVVWQEILKQLSPQVMLHSLFSGGQIVGVSENCVVVRFGKQHETFVRAWEMNKKKDFIRDAACKVLGRNAGIRFEVADTVDLLNPSPA